MTSYRRRQWTVSLVCLSMFVLAWQDKNNNLATAETSSNNGNSTESMDWHHHRRRRIQHVSSYWTADRIRQAQPAVDGRARERPTKKSSARALPSSSSSSDDDDDELVVARHVEQADKYRIHLPHIRHDLECRLYFESFNTDNDNPPFSAVNASTSTSNNVVAVAPRHESVYTSPYLDLVLDVKQADKDLFVWLDINKAPNDDGRTLHPIRLNPIHGSGRYTLHRLGPFPTDQFFRWTVTGSSHHQPKCNEWQTFCTQSNRGLRSGGSPSNNPPQVATDPTVPDAVSTTPTSMPNYEEEEEEDVASDKNTDTTDSDVATPETLPAFPSWLEYLTPVADSTVFNPIQVEWKINHPSAEYVFGYIHQADGIPKTDYWAKQHTPSGRGSVTLGLLGTGPVTLTLGIQLRNGGGTQMAPPIMWHVDYDSCPVPLGRFDDHSKSLYKAVGRLVMSHGDRDYYCSGTLVEGNDDRLVIVTAAHCLFRKDVGSFYDNIMFIPGHGGNDGKTDCIQNPQQCLYPVKAVVSDQYVDSILADSWQVDYGFLVAPKGVSDNTALPGNNRNLRNRGPSSATAVKTPPSTLSIKPMTISFDPLIVGKETSLFGYPLNKDPDFMYSVGQLAESPFEEEEGYYLACSDLRDGSSGGPWTQSVSSNGDIVVSSINSWSWIDGSPGMGAPRFDRGGAACVYESANGGTIDSDGMASVVVSCSK